MPGTKVYLESLVRTLADLKNFVAQAEEHNVPIGTRVKLNDVDETIRVNISLQYKDKL